MVNFTKYKLSEVATFEISNVDKKTKEGQPLVRLCNFVDVYYNWAITSSMQSSFMVASANQSQIEKFRLKRGQVAITKDSETRHDIGIPTYIADDFENVILGYHCALITPNPDLVVGRYLNAFLNSRMAKEYFANNASGSGQRYALPIDAIADIIIYLPPLDVQKEVGNLLSDIDRKIALNREINRNLEAMARQLYDYWFVQFDFPDENGKPYKSSGGKMVWNEKLKREIPIIFNHTKIDEVVEILDSKRVPLSVFQRSERSGIYPYYGATGIMDYINDFIFDEELILLAEDGSTSDTEGYPIVQYVWGKYWVNNHAHILRPKLGDGKLFLYYTLKNIPAKKIETGSIQKKISQSNLTGYNIAYPPQSLINKYSEIVIPLWNEYMSLCDEIIALQQQRDELLPLLMNGQVSVMPTEVNCDLFHD